ncbi:MAG: hypothetical protein KJN62_01515, partial [Deltaproteobacteria bacterium]|nr:hypothetical protein [Deltaproteobacteria bacterium]
AGVSMGGLFTTGAIIIGLDTGSSVTISAIVHFVLLTFALIGIPIMATCMPMAISRHCRKFIATTTSFLDNVVWGAHMNAP